MKPESAVFVIAVLAVVGVWLYRCLKRPWISQRHQILMAAIDWDPPPGAEKSVTVGPGYEDVRIDVRLRGQRYPIVFHWTPYDTRYELWDMLDNSIANQMRMREAESNAAIRLRARRFYKLDCGDGGLM